MTGRIKFWGYITAFGCFVVMFVHLGMMTSIGLFIPHIAADLEIAISKVSYIVTFATLSAFICSFFAARVFERFSARYVLLFASALSAIHYVIYSYADNIFPLYIGGVLAGLVLGLGANACIASILSSWFIEKRSTVIGIVFGGAALGGAATQLLAGHLIEEYGWRNTYLILAGIAFLVAATANLLLIRNPEKIGQKPLGWENAQKINMIDKKRSGVSLQRARKKSSFWFCMVGIVLIGPLITGFQAYAPTYWQMSGATALDTAKYMSLLSLLGAAGTILGGIIAEKFGSKVYITYCVCAYIIGVGLVLIVPEKSSMILLIIAITLIGTSFPLSNSVPATITTNAFGTHDYSKVCAWFMAALYFGKMIGSPLMGAIMDVTGNIKNSFAVLIVLAATALLLLIVGLITAPLNTYRNKVRESAVSESLNQDHGS